MTSSSSQLFCVYINNYIFISSDMLKKKCDFIYFSWAFPYNSKLYGCFVIWNFNNGKIPDVIIRIIAGKFIKYQKLHKCIEIVFVNDIDGRNAFSMQKWNSFNDGIQSITVYRASISLSMNIWYISYFGLVIWCNFIHRTS